MGVLSLADAHSSLILAKLNPSIMRALRGILVLRILCQLNYRHPFHQAIGNS